MKAEYLYKIIFVGPSNSGAKTSLIFRIVNNYCEENFIPTIGVDFKLYEVKTNYGNVKLQIWDTAGQERFLDYQQSYYKNGHCLVFGYDITNKESFQELKKLHYKKILKYLNSNQKINPLIYLVANKIDLQEDIQVPDEEAISFANKKQIPYFKVSAKTGEGVDNLINHIVNSLIKKFPNSIINQNKAIIFDEKKKKKVSNISLKTLNKEDKQHFLFLDKYYNY